MRTQFNEMHNHMLVKFIKRMCLHSHSQKMIEDAIGLLNGSREVLRSQIDIVHARMLELKYRHVLCHNFELYVDPLEPKILYTMLFLLFCTKLLCFYAIVQH